MSQLKNKKALFVLKLKYRCCSVLLFSTGSSRYRYRYLKKLLKFQSWQRKMLDPDPYSDSRRDPGIRISKKRRRIRKIAFCCCKELISS